VPGDSEDEWRQQISSAIPSASVVIGFVHARNSPYLRAEWQVAQSSGTPLLLILAEDSPWLSGAAELAGVPCVDARLLQNSDADHADTWSQLSALIGRGVVSSRRLGANVTPVGVDLARYRRLLDSLDRSSGTV
jgi:hypothetical protein